MLRSDIPKPRIDGSINTFFSIHSATVDEILAAIWSRKQNGAISTFLFPEKSIAALTFSLIIKINLCCEQHAQGQINSIDIYENGT